MRGFVFLHLRDDGARGQVPRRQAFPVWSGGGPELSFGLGGIAAGVLGFAADRIRIIEVFKLCAFLPAVGLLTVFLPHSLTFHSLLAGSTGSAVRS